MVLNLPQGHEDSEYVLNFEIGQREGGFYCGRTDRQTDRTTKYIQITYREIFSQSCWIKPNLDCNYTFPIDLAPKGILFDVKSMGKI